MNRDKLDRYMLTRPRNICPKTALNTSAITQFTKEKPANFMEATTKAGEEYNEESKIESQTLHYVDVFSFEFVVHFLWERLTTKFFFGEVGELAEVAPYKKRKQSHNARMDQEAEQISQLSQITNTEIFPIIQQI